MAEYLSRIFKKNRAEAFSDDLWNKFVLPIDYEKHNLLTHDKGVKVIGGRGTGKTMFLKYHCFPTQLSKQREIITRDDIPQIGIYWRPDTHFVQLINEKFLGQQWNSVFNTYTGLSFIIKFSQFIKSFIDSNYYDNNTKEELCKLKISDVLKQELKCENNISYLDLAKHCRGLLYKLQNWINRKYDEVPIIIDGKASLLFIIEELKEIELLDNITFHIFIDEFENLREEQQRIVNDWMKHGENPLLFSVAYKKYAIVSDFTTGNEKTQRRNDHRIIDIVDEIYARDEQAFKIFASEIIMSKVQEFLDNEIIDKDLLYDTSKMQQRKTERYQTNIIQKVINLFPEKDYKEMAFDILKDDTLSNKVSKNINQALELKSSKLKYTDFIDDEYPDASVVNSILLFRTKTNPIKLKEIFEKFKRQLKTKEVDAYKELITSNIVGAILYIYISFPKRICPIYSGFNRFCLMSKNNLRHLLELCYQSFMELEENDKDYNEFKNGSLTVPTKYQLLAAKNCSKQELETLSELGPFGQDLQKIANRLGRIFHLKQKIRTQSKPENIHFSVETLVLDNLDDNIKALINEAKIWNVLQEYDATKGTEKNLATKEYMLTPILAPYYQITHRKIHKIDFTVEQLKIIFLQNDANFDELYNKLIRTWKIDDTNSIIQGSLFGEEF